MALIEVLAAVVATALTIIIYFKLAFSFWEKRNLPSLTPSIPFGTVEDPLTRRNSPGIATKNEYDKLKALGYKHAGSYRFTLPRYIPIHPEFVKNVIQKDFLYFTERGFYYNEKDEPLSAHVFALGGQKWKNMRSKLTPTFTSGKMKMMFETLLQCGDQMLEAIDGYHQRKEAVDIKEVVACYTTDTIGSCAFGLECNSFKKPDAEFRKYGKKIFEQSSKLRNAKLVLAGLNPEWGHRLGVTFFPKETTDFFLNVIRDTVNYRETNKVNRNDMLKLLIDLKNNRSHNEVSNGTGELGNGVLGAKEGDGLTMEQLAAQAFIFFIGGFETSSTLITFIIYELSKDFNIQQKVRDEINLILSKHGGKLTYDAIMDMTYMSQVIDETLRKYPPLPVINRMSVEDYKVPGTDVVLPKGVNVSISVLGIHHDAEYYPEPDKFDPERFSEENKQKRHPFTFIPFGEGPRMCLGLRFALMETKVGLTLLLKNYRFSLNKNTVDPLVMKRLSFVPTPATGIFVDIERV